MPPMGLINWQHLLFSVANFTVTNPQERGEVIWGEKTALWDECGSPGYLGTPVSF